NLPNVLDFSHDESWQRVGATGDVAADWIIGTSTIGEHNTISAEQRAAGDIVISELAGAGPAGDGDDFVELRNDGDTAVDLGGWTLDRCTASGRLRPAGRELVVPAGTELRPGATWLAAGPGYAPDGASAPDGRYDTSLADVEFGVLLRDGDGRLADRVAVSQYDDSACQGEGSKLPAILDAAAGESWQRAAHGWIVARRTPGAPNATAQASLFETPFFYPTRLGVAISEIATDPAPDALPPGATQRNWIELGNYGDTAVDVGGWTLWRCQADGARGFTPQVTIAAGTTIQPGSTFLAARSGTAAAAHADATYGTALNFLGSGVWLADATGRRIDSAGIYGQNEMDESIVVASPCTKGAALTTYQPDRMLGETFQRTQFTGVDDDDFVTAVATPGVIDQIPWADPTMRVPGVIAPGDEPAEPVVTGAVGIQGATGVRAQIAKTAPVLERRLAIVGAWAGASAGPLTTERTDGEVTLDAAALAAGALGAIGDDGYDFPYQRLVLDGGGLDAGDAIGWSGTTQPRQEVQVSAWNAGAWRLIGAAAGDPESGAVEVGGTLEEGDFRDGRVTLLVQDGPRTVATIASGIDGRLQDPGAYDFAISHITDTQYMTEDYPQYYAQLVSWIADHADDRKIAFATHTGDIVQNWV
ncbi:MAG: lamin tail domain-containing protein, partial [Pseudolysinimonas sp.]